MTLLLAAVMISLWSDLDPTGLRHTTPLKDQVDLRLGADRDVYYRGDVVHLRLTAVNVTASPVTAFLTLSPRFGDAHVLYRRVGSVFQEIDWLRQRDLEPMSGRRTLAPGESHGIDIDLSVTDYRAGLRAFLLDEIGIYEFKVTYQDTPVDPNGALESNAVTVEVAPTPPEEVEAQAHYTPDLAYVGQFQWGRSVLSAEETEAAAGFIERFPGTRKTVQVREGLRRSLDYRIRTNQATEEERALHERLFGATDVTPPILSIQISPGSLWPPNHRLVPIAVSVQAGDESGDAPIVRLESITCDDGCDAAADVINAAIGTDDRSFELRAEHSGSGGGRTYTITYSAEDAAGNKTTASTTVTVPHDQAEKK